MCCGFLFMAGLVNPFPEELGFLLYFYKKILENGIKRTSAFYHH